MPPRLLRLGDDVQRQRRLAGGFRPVNLHDAAARQAADAERDIEPERAGGDGLHVHRLVVLPSRMMEPLPNWPLDLAERGGKGFRLVHGRSFDDTQRRLTHDVAPIRPENRPPDNASPCPYAGIDRKKQCTLFVLCSQYVLFNMGHIYTLGTSTGNLLEFRDVSTRNSPLREAWAKRDGADHLIYANFGELSVGG